MYMTRVILECVPQPNAICEVLRAAFPGEHSDKAMENLWRVDELEDGKELLVVSSHLPQLQPIAKEIGTCDERNKTLPYAPFLGRLENGQAWNFRLCANPVGHKKKNASDKREKLYALRTAAEQLEWLGEQGLKHGFDVKECSVISDEWRMFKADKDDKKDAARLLAVTFEGLLVVTDAEAFRTALTQGIGRGKTHGCGLLTLAKNSP